MLRNALVGGCYDRHAAFMWPLFVGVRMTVRDGGQPPENKLLACESFARVPSAKLESVMDAWCQEVRLRTPQEQLSLPYVARRYGLEPLVWASAQTASPWLLFGAHGR